jgi:FtsH-binding integral membrane protein
MALALVILLTFRIEKMSLGAAQAAFWIYAGLVGLSFSSIFFVLYRHEHCSYLLHHRRNFPRHEPLWFTTHRS